MKKRYIGAYINWFDNDLILSEIMAENEVEVLKMLLLEYCGEEDREEYAECLKEYKTVGAMKTHAFDCDCMVSAKEVVNKITKEEYLKLLADKVAILKSKCKNDYYLDVIVAEDGATIGVNPDHNGITIQLDNGKNRYIMLDKRPWLHEDYMSHKREFLIAPMNDIIEGDVELCIGYLNQIK